MPNALLKRQTHRPKPGFPFLDGLSLTPARAHEFCGPARRSLALIVARATRGPIYWIAPAWARDRLNGEGIAEFIDPGRITFVTPQRPEDLLWVMEEVLRSGIIPLVVCELPGIPGLTPVRRLHLAAETAPKHPSHTPLGLVLIAGQGGAQGVESRWHMAPFHTQAQTRWRLDRRRDRMAAPKSWNLTKQGQRFVLGPPQTGTHEVET